MWTILFPHTDTSQNLRISKNAIRLCTTPTRSPPELEGDFATLKSLNQPPNVESYLPVEIVQSSTAAGSILAHRTSQDTDPTPVHDAQPDDKCQNATVDQWNIEFPSVSLMAECQRPAQVPWNQNGLLSPSSYIAYSYFPFITLGNLSSVPAQDFQFLELQGCLYVPSRPILDKFTRQYFLHMHPLLPALNEGDFWDMYFQHSNPRAPGRKISLLVFQAMLFLCCNFVPETMLSTLGLHTTQKACAIFYRRATLLLDLDTESSPIANVPWLSIAIQYTKDAEAHYYKTFDIDSDEYFVLKRLWWCCIIRDRIFGLGMRRGIQITGDQFDFVGNPRLCNTDLADEIHWSTVHSPETNIYLADILDLLVELRVVLTDILDLAFPIEESLSRGAALVKDRGRIRSCQVALHKGHRHASLRLPKFSTSLALPEEPVYHDTVILYTNLLRMYYYSSKVVLSHHEILQLAAGSMSCHASSSDIFILKDNRSELQDAVLGTTGCLEKLTRLQLAR
ncbi:hypothetical protein BGZ61DRAFT_542417 [Ilyonectria robusta]|uniref:uncharacterized protein n=1 Tax=Ilyonectria robusta TaxID=1079257 RepID=UPI001E8E5440|nr:uncharacterized protein BGZ61DRAFT_542417 [Ilyonectria robusta]KAH8648257.1 hypothetical protein BGZ61DRAFT_542417 [Ilyonectria robusta]